MHVAATVEVIARTVAASGHARRDNVALRAVDDGRHVFVEFPCRPQKRVALSIAQHRQPAQVALNHLVTRRRRAEEEAALAAGLDEGHDLLAAASLGELQVAADVGFASVDRVPAAGLGGLDHEAIAQIGRDTLPPGGEEGATGVKVQHLQIARDRAADQAQCILRIGEPRMHLGLGRQPLLKRLPFALDGRPLLGPMRRQDTQAGRKVG